MNVNFRITRENFETITWDEWEALEAIGEGDFKPRALKRVAARFLVNEENAPLEEREALKLLGALGSKEMFSALGQLAQAIREYAVPKDNGNGSSSR